MSTLTPDMLSRYRQTIRHILRKIERLATRCLYKDSLIHGSPAVVFRKCGNPKCKCARDPEKRHGPYKVIQTVNNGRSRQVCLRKDQEQLWQLAKNYQYQMAQLQALKKECQALYETITDVITHRTQDPP